MGLLEQAQQEPVTPGLAEAAASAGAPGVQAPTTGQPPAGVPQAPTTGQPPAGPPAGAGGPPEEGGDLPAPEEPASPEEQKEYERAMRAVARVLYSNDKTANSIVDQVDPNDKVSSTAKVSLLFIQQLDRKINLDETVIPSITQEVVGRITELAEARHGVEYTPQEQEQTFGATWEGIQSLYGADPADFSQRVQSMDSGKLEALKQQHEARLNG